MYSITSVPCYNLHQTNVPQLHFTCFLHKHSHPLNKVFNCTDLSTPAIRQRSERFLGFSARGLIYSNHLATTTLACHL